MDDGEDEQMSRETQVFEIPLDKYAIEIGFSAGINIALDLLEKEKCNFPGFNLAMAIVARKAAEHQAALSRIVYKQAAGFGADIAASSAVYTYVKDGKLIMTVEYNDLVDEAEK